MVRAAVLAGDVGRGGAGEDCQLVPGLDDVADGEGSRGQRHVGDQVNALIVEPIARYGHGHIRLQLQIGGNKLDLDVGVATSEVLDRELRADHRSLAGIRGIRADHVRQHADADGFLLRPGKSWQHGACGASGHHGPARQYD